MSTTNEDLLQKLEEIKQMIQEMKQEEELVFEGIQKFEVDEQKLIELLGRHAKKRFDNIVSWKRFVWDTCEYRKPIPKETEIDFHCANIPGQLLQRFFLDISI